MIIQLDNDLWARIFATNDLLTREDIASSFGMTWDNWPRNSEDVRHYALGVFQLRPEKKDFGRFVLVKSFYQKRYHTISGFETKYLFSFAENHEDALLEFLPYLSKEEQEWLHTHLHLKDHPAYQG